MAGTVLVDAGFLIALLSRRDRHHRWAAAQFPHLPRPWKTREAVLSEAFHLLGAGGGPALEIASDGILLTTDADFHIYRRHGRQVVPCLTPY
jgi:hypothetical protein